MNKFENDPYSAILIAEGVETASERDQLEAWSLIIKNEMYLQLQGFFGRTASLLIDAGIIDRDGTINEEYVKEIESGETLLD